MNNIRIEDGFSGQIMHVTPSPLLAEASKNVLVRELYATHIGWFPPAKHHYIYRPDGANEHILIYCTGGAGWFEIEDRREKISPGEALLIPPQKRHSYGADPKTPWSIHWVHFTGEDSDYYASIMPDSEYRLNISPVIKNKIVTLFEECFSFLDFGHTQKSIFLCSQTLRHLLALLFSGNPAFSPGTPQTSHRSFENVIEYMRENLDGNLTLEAIARKAGLSPTRFSAVFKHQTGLSPVEYYIRLRIQTACRLFDTTALNVAEIAQQIGYEDPCYFSRIFKKIMDMSPSDYRRQHRQRAP